MFQSKFNNFYKLHIQPPFIIISRLPVVFQLNVRLTFINKKYFHFSNNPSFVYKQSTKRNVWYKPLKIVTPTHTRGRYYIYKSKQYFAAQFRLHLLLSNTALHRYCFYCVFPANSGHPAMLSNTLLHFFMGQSR